ncbi:polynucleotide 5'-hydroxyl-kinase nol9 [Phtheirospermum japonicum]|uniref:Polynucleotide 5'-hydroxyl-kinase nol9 n=1 Tax=Phtheirospermum japonicum TaxID=374723 RepID=A0A830BD18_9LAMI|nr:polynucleotide 5'-hydroxyl-kinase nol9 [Phtheirospermum japonicum]
MAAASEIESSSPKIFIPEEWSNAAESIASGSVAFPIAFVCGPKNSGKTTFSRHLLNVLLQRHKKVAYLDTDVGQTEFTPPGLLSLTVIDKITLDLAIPCLKTPARCFFFGDISSKRDPTTYLTYILALYDHYMKEYRMDNNIETNDTAGLPLVINTPGWVKGIGYELIVDMLKHMSPTHVVKIRISAESKNLPPGAFWLNEENADDVTIVEIGSARQDYLKRSVLVQKDARLLRDLRVMAYFRQCFPSDMTISTIKELARALASHPPYEISISSIQIKHVHCQVPVNEAFYSLNATIVGLAVSSVSEQWPQCVGLGIVRGIDTLRGVLHVLTPVPQQSLEDVDMLLQGFIQIPTALLQVQGCISPYMSANVLSTN